MFEFFSLLMNLAIMVLMANMPMVKASNIWSIPIFRKLSYKPNSYLAGCSVELKVKTS